MLCELYLNKPLLPKPNPRHVLEKPRHPAEARSGPRAGSGPSWGRAVTERLWAAEAALREGNQVDPSGTGHVQTSVFRLWGLMRSDESRGPPACGGRRKARRAPWVQLQGCPGSPSRGVCAGAAHWGPSLAGGAGVGEGVGSRVTRWDPRAAGHPTICPFLCPQCSDPQMGLG